MEGQQPHDLDGHFPYPILSGHTITLAIDGRPDWSRFQINGGRHNWMAYVWQNTLVPVGCMPTEFVRRRGDVLEIEWEDDSSDDYGEARYDRAFGVINPGNEISIYDDGTYGWIPVRVRATGYERIYFYRLV